MTCYYPLQGFKSKSLSKNGKRTIVFNPRDAISTSKLFQVSVPCGQCVGCRLERSRQWAVRCVHEASLYDDNCFITLTYNSANLPPDSSLVVSHFQKFMKRLRKRFGEGIRFFHCGEYGEKFGRPHYHACLFNFDFPDKVLFKELSDGNRLFTSKILEELWPFGFSTVGSVTFESAAYVARYIMKKVTGDLAKEHYQAVNVNTGELVDRKPEYTTMSRRPGIGKAWFDKFSSDIYPRDEVVLRGKRMRPPKFYDSQFEIIEPELYSDIKVKRKISAKKFSENNSLMRLATRGKRKELDVQKLFRTLDGEC